MKIPGSAGCLCSEHDHLVALHLFLLLVFHDAQPLDVLRTRMQADAAMGMGR